MPTCQNLVEYGWNERIQEVPTLSLLGSTKLQILNILRRSPCTVHDLAVILDLTDNAVRTHVLALERDRLIEPHSRRPGVRKPAIVYGLAPAADQLLPKPYAAVLNAVLDEVEVRQGTDEITSIARSIGENLAEEHWGRVANLQGRERIEAIARLIDQIGGLAEVEEKDGRFVLNGFSCPLVAVVPNHPQICTLTKTFIQDLLGHGTVHERCDHQGSDVRCRFEIEPEPSAAG